MENSYHMYQNVSFSKSKLWQTLALGHLIQVESWIIFVRKAGVFPLEKVRQHKKFFIVNEIRRMLLKIRSCIVLNDAISKNFVANEHHSFTFVFTFSVVVVDLPTDCILSFLFPAETDVLVPVFSQSTDVVVVNFVVVLKFPVVQHATTIVRLVCMSDLACFCFSPVRHFWLWSCKGISKPFLPFPEPSGFAAPLPKLCARLPSRWLLLLTATTVFVMLLLLLPSNFLRLLSR